MKIVVVIPARNEAKGISVTLRRLMRSTPADQIVVCDSASTDDTARIARETGVHVVGGAHISGRGEAINAATEAAFELHPDVEAIWFLHADCDPPAGWPDIISRALASDDVAGGAFGQRFPMDDSVTMVQRRLLRFVCWCNRLRYRITGLYFGDQGIFARASALRQIDGIPKLRLFEDVELVRRLRTVGRVVLLKDRLSTSPRRFLDHGIIRQLLADTWLIFKFWRGMSTDHLITQYNAHRT